MWKKNIKIHVTQWKKLVWKGYRLHDFKYVACRKHKAVELGEGSARPHLRREEGFDEQVGREGFQAMKPCRICCTGGHIPPSVHSKHARWWEEQAMRGFWVIMRFQRSLLSCSRSTVLVEIERKSRYIGSLCAFCSFCPDIKLLKSKLHSL